MIATSDETVQIRESNDVVRVRQVVRARAIAAGLGLVDQTKIITAASELARNTLGLRPGRHRQGRGLHHGRRAAA